MILVCRIFSIKKIIFLYKNLTRIQLLTTCVENILCFIFVVFGMYKKTLTTRISQITDSTVVALKIRPVKFGNVYFWTNI